jgi:SAM-dependent methyltransferase
LWVAERLPDGDSLTDNPRIFTSDYYADLRKLEAGAWWNAGMRSIAMRLLRSLELPSTGRMLDAGCGSGQTMTWLAELLPRWDRVGVDVAREAVASARSIGEKVSEASVLSLPFGDATFDLAITLDVLQHLPLDGGDSQALTEIRRVLKPGGGLLIRTNAQSFPRLPEDPASLYRRYDPAPLRRIIERAGFDVLRLSRANSILGLAEIPRELRAKQRDSGSYHGLLSAPRAPRRIDRIKRGVIEAEGALLSRGVRLPFGRTLFALCRAA